MMILEDNTHSILSIYILTRDRLDYLEDCIESVLNSSLEYTNVILSDNSIGDTVESFVRDRFPKLNYVRRSPPLSTFIDHYTAILNECFSEYIVFFHDDDLMGPGYVKTMLQSIGQHPACAAVACNAFIMRDQRLTNITMFQPCNRKLLVSNPETILDYYFSSNNTAPPPYPSYIFRTNLLKSSWNPKVFRGKHSDVISLVELIKYGYLIWDSKPLLIYRTHFNHLSSVETIQDRLCLLRYLYKSRLVDRHSKRVKRYKLLYWLKWSSQNANKFILSSPFRRRYMPVILFIMTDLNLALKAVFLTLYSRYLLPLVHTLRGCD